MFVGDSSNKSAKHSITYIVKVLRIEMLNSIMS